MTMTQTSRESVDVEIERLDGGRGRIHKPSPLRYQYLRSIYRSAYPELVFNIDCEVYQL